MSLKDAPRNVKLKPLTMLLLVAALAALAYAALGASVLRQRSERDALSSQIESAEAVVATAKDIRQNLADLPARLDTAREQLAAAQTAFPSELDSDALLRTLLGYANESKVRVLEVHTQLPTAETDELEASAYRALGFDLRAEGTFEQIVAFLAAIEEGAASASRTGAFSLQQSEGRYVLSLEVLSYGRSAPGEVAAAETIDGSASPMTDAPNGGENAPHE